MVVFILCGDVFSYEGYRGYSGNNGYSGYLSREQKAALIKAGVDSFFAVQERKAEAERLRLAEIERKRKEVEERQRQAELESQKINQMVEYNSGHTQTYSNQVYPYSNQYTLGPVYFGVASRYHSSLDGNPTSNGEIYNERKLTAAHRTLPFNTWVRVTNIFNGRSVLVRINDRGPFVKGRDIDLSKAAMSEIADLRQGLVRVKMEVINMPPQYQNWPTPGYYRIVSRFGASRSGGLRRHKGIDIGTPDYVPVRSSALGIVAWAGHRGKYGNVVYVRHLNGYETRYAHLSRIHVRYGQIVNQSTVLGLTGQTGNSTSPHLHYEVRRYGRALNPVTMK